MNLAELALASRRLAATASRLEKVQQLATLLGALAPDEVAVAVSWLGGELPQGRIGVGWASLREAMGAPEASAPPPLTLLEVDALLTRVAATAGRGSAGERARLLAELFARAPVAERDFITRLIQGELRQGALGGVMDEAIARAASLPAASVRRAIMLGERGAVARAALLEGAAGLARFDLRLFQPVQPMLAQSAEGVEDAVARLGRAAHEYKLDGARIQVHRQGGEVRVFSRGLNDVTEAVPEVVEAALALPARELILDGEALSLRPDGTPLPFQATMRRFGRKLDVARLRREQPLAPFFFDLLYIDGQSLLEDSAEERFAALDATVEAHLRVPRLVADAADAGAALAAAELLARSLAAGHEGIMSKSLASPYEAGSRGAAWLKVKPAHTLDLVVLAAEWGNGRRQGWLSNLHLGARDPEGGGFVMLGKTFKGMTDEMLGWQTARLLTLETARDGHVVHVRPELVVEIAFDTVQGSPHYPGGMALRFARVKRYREDKSAAEADSIDSVRAIFARAQGE